MNDRFRLPNISPRWLTQHGIALPALQRRAGLPEGFLQQERIYATTAQLFALWRAIREMSPDPGIGLKLGAEPRFDTLHHEISSTP